MAKIVVNENLKVNGRLTFERSFVEEEYLDENEQVKIKKSMRIDGVFATHLYFDEIHQLDTSRFSIGLIEVYKEAFGSDDYEILYYFTAKYLDVMGTEEDGVKYVLFGKEMKMIEEEMYEKDAHPILGNIGAEYKDMFIEELENNDEEEEVEVEEDTE